MTSGKFKSNASGVFRNFIKISFYTRSGYIAFVWHLLFIRQYRNSAAKIDINNTAFFALDKTGNNLVFFVFKLAKNTPALGFADFLDNYLFGGLSGNAAIVFFCLKRENQFIA